MVRRLAVLSVVLLTTAQAWAGVVEKKVEYKQGNTVLEGFLAFPEGSKGKAPGVVVVHEWMGPGDHVRRSARNLAAMGYVALAADIYGKGVRPSDVKGAQAESSKYKGDRALMRARAQAALDLLKKQKGVDASNVAAIGYCFGGTVVLEMARAGMPVKGVVSFHGGLDTPKPAPRVKAKVLVLHGGDDPFVPPDQVAAFQDEMRKAGADWQLVTYGGAVHSFTNPQATGKPNAGAKYDERSDLRSWDALVAFLEEIFSRR
jgi:dienelactone hydrolase